MQYSSSSENYSSSSRKSPGRWNSEKDGKEYKSASYKYSSSLGGKYETKGASNSNVDQLDALLEDLKNERRISSKDKDYGLPTSSYIIKEQERSSSTVPLVSEVSKITKTTKHLEPTKTYSTNKYYNEYEKKETISEELPVLVKNTTKLDSEIKDIALPANILPPPGTKVTTTVRTYTYEIPPDEADYSHTINRHIVNRSDESTEARHKVPLPVGGSTKYHSESYSSTSTTEKIPPVVPISNTYLSESYSSSSKTEPLPVTSGSKFLSESYSSTSKTEPLPVVTGSKYISESSYSSSRKTEPIPVTTGGKYISESYSSTRQTEPLPLPLPLPVGPPNQIYEVREIRETTRTTKGPGPNNVVFNVTSAPRTPTDGQVINKTIITNVDRSYTNPPPPIIESTNLASYNYSSTTTTTNRRGPGSDYGTPIKPAPFPVERGDFQIPVEQTPTKVDDLMQSFQQTDISEVDSTVRKREVDTSTASPQQQHVPSVNRPGKEVFYPPGHEKMISKYQESAGMQGGGRWAKAAGNYEYESGAKSSSKSKSGGAMVPVCLPLCCAMPCSIM